MPLLGEVPITSFFKPNPDSKKRKAKATSAPSLKKRKNEYPEGSTKDPEVTRWFTRKEEELDRVSSIINIRPCEAPKRMFSVGQGARTPKTPSMMATKKKDSGHEHLNSNSPVTHEAPPRKRQSTASGSGHSHNAPKFSDYEIDRKLVYFLPTPVTMKRQSSRQLRCQGCHTDETPSKKINSGAITIPTTLNLEPMDSDVPSSQSQNISPMTHSLSTGPALLEKPPSFLAPPPNSVLRSAQKDEHNPDILDGRDAPLLVDSSQSQMFGSLDEQPRSPGAIHLCLPEEDSVFTIPSSQSQESELILPHLEMKTRLQKTKTHPRYQLSRSSPTKAGTTPNQIPRMLSDELFSAPIQHSLLGEIRQEDESPEDSLRASDFAQPAENPDDLSATESESESEAGELLRPSNQLANPAIHGALVRQWHFSPHGSPHHITTYDDSLGGESLSSRLSQSTVASPESSYSSFPFAVREFRNMFGSNDESYPPDFPMSLR
ncbi:hypothetical protein GALMADRAFT_235571 [Galerina marginata CBS 339.88]|uniref:Uncharacterized protein n=1 Tax=Galerina marginata (strain CBS 339.88) TaxID=685588 RepID=A0A067TWS0_GALM3|nr:hypothetical protein GALMADRAFT_235571 [Galerina marginata CBS 339.88]